MKKLWLKEKIGQKLMIGFDGLFPGKEVRDLIQERAVGGVVLFKRNIETPEQTAEMCNQLQDLSPQVPLFIAIDQEGGRISRVPPPFTQFPSMQTLGQIGSEDLAFSVGEVIGRELKSIGVNINFAPVLDVDTNPDNPIIGGRSFSADPETVTAMACQFIGGLHQSGVIATGKHFPGHGDTSIDSHEDLPEVAHPRKRLKRVEFPPFLAAIREGLSAMMTAHILLPKLDPRWPATLSRTIIQGILREQLNFSGVVFTDDLDMKAIHEKYDFEEVVVKSVVAGVDVLLICHDSHKPLMALEIMEELASYDPIFKKHIEKSADRILSLKEQFCLSRQHVDLEQVSSVIGCREHQSLAERISSSKNIA